MDKIKSILASAAGRKVGPPVPPRPTQAAVQKALEKTRHQSPILSQITSPIVHGRTIIYSSSPNSNNEHVDRQPHSSNNVRCETKCFDTEIDDSSTGFAAKLVQNGNSARVDANEVMKVGCESSPVILHHKSPVPSPRSKTPPLVTVAKVSTVLVNAPMSTEANYQQSSYANLLRRNQNFPADGETVKYRTIDDELKEKLLNEMMNRADLVEASNKHVKFNGSNLKRSTSFDMLNESLGERANDKKVIFHEMLISELSEMRRVSNPRLSSAKSSPDISANGNFNIFDLNEKKSFNTFVSLEDSGVEDEGKTDDCSSSGVGDSWDSCKEMENR
jgi:hypothetical protein